MLYEGYIGLKEGEGHGGGGRRRAGGRGVEDDDDLVLLSQLWP